MPRNLALALLTGALILTGAGCLAQVDPEVETADTMMKSEETDDDSMMKVEGEDTGEAMEKTDDTMMEKPVGSYESYAPSKLARASSGDIVLFFRASWCPSCKAVDADIRSHLEEIPAGLTILDVDYDTETALKQKYGVTYQHTFVQVDTEGKQIAKWSGSPTLSALVSEVK